MSIPKSILAVALALALFGLRSAQAQNYADTAQSKQGAKKQLKVKEAGRGLASVSSKSTAQMGQGELMLNNVRSPSPRFLKPVNTTSPVQLAGVCRTPSGVACNSTEKDYVTHLDTKAEGSGSVNEYFGSAQRQAGVGILVGN